MPDTNYFNEQRRRDNGKDDAVRTFAYPISTFRPNQLFDSGRERTFGKLPDGLNNSHHDLLRKILESLIAECFHSIL